MTEAGFYSKVSKGLVMALARGRGETVELALLGMASAFNEMPVGLLLCHVGTPGPRILSGLRVNFQ
jgi:hypothetical protein